jgi:hypothetical protein
MTEVRPPYRVQSASFLVVDTTKVATFERERTIYGELSLTLHSTVLRTTPFGDKPLTLKIYHIPKASQT